MVSQVHAKWALSECAQMISTEVMLIVFCLGNEPRLAQGKNEDLELKMTSFVVVIYAVNC